MMQMIARSDEGDSWISNSHMLRVNEIKQFLQSLDRPTLSVGFWLYLKESQALLHLY